MRRAVVAFALATCMGLVSSHAVAAPTKINVLQIMSDDAFQQAQALTTALKHAAEHSEGFTLDKGDFSLEVLVAALNCPAPPDAGCQQRIGKKVGTDAYVWGTAHLDGNFVVADLHLWQGVEKHRKTLRYAANLTDGADDTLIKIAESGFSALAGAAQGTLVVSAGTVDGKVLVDGEEVGELSHGQGEFQVPIGSHEVRVRAAGYNDAVGTADVGVTGKSEVKLSPTASASPEPGGGDAGVVVDTHKPTSTRRVLGIAGIGVGAVLIGGGFYSWVKINSINTDDRFDSYRKALPRGKDVCDQAQAGVAYPGAASPAEVADLCSSAHTWQTLQYVFFGAGAVLAGTGAILLLTDKPAQAAREPAFQPMVAVGPSGGRVDVRVAF